MQDRRQPPSVVGSLHSLCVSPCLRRLRHPAESAMRVASERHPLGPDENVLGTTRNRGSRIQPQAGFAKLIGLARLLVGSLARWLVGSLPRKRIVAFTRVDRFGASACGAAIAARPVIVVQDKERGLDAARCSLGAAQCHKIAPYIASAMDSMKRSRGIVLGRPLTPPPFLQRRGPACMQVIAGALRVRGGAEDETLVVFEDGQPVPDIGSMGHPELRAGWPRSAERKAAPSSATSASRA